MQQFNQQFGIKNKVLIPNIIYDIYYFNKKGNVQIRLVFSGKREEAFFIAEENWLDDSCYFLMYEDDVNTIIFHEFRNDNRKRLNSKMFIKAQIKTEIYSKRNQSFVVKKENGIYKTYYWEGKKEEKNII